jgi:hypothetical protein
MRPVLTTAPMSMAKIMLSVSYVPKTLKIMQGWWRLSSLSRVLADRGKLTAAGDFLV